MVLIAAAVIPAVVLLVRVYRLDRLEKEPFGLLAALLILGVIATALASLTEQLGDIALSFCLSEHHPAYPFILYFVIVAVSEEGFKYLLLKNRTWRSPHFNCLFDGVVYAVFVSLGFALWENIAYVLRYGMAVALARAVTAVPGHACFGAFMGVFYGVAKRQLLAGDVESSLWSRRLAVLLPVLLHGLYDFIATQQTDGLSVVFIVFVALLYFVAYRLAATAARNDRYLDPPPM